MPKRANNASGQTDKAFRDALKKAYLERARIFVKGLSERGVTRLIAYLNRQSSEGFDWNLDSLAISKAAFEKVRRAGVQPHMVFCHPEILKRRREVLSYYRNLAALSTKGLNQLAIGLTGPARVLAQLRTINEILSALVDDIDVFELALAQSVIPAEIGTELQGRWVNIIGQGAAKRVRKLINDFVEQHRLVASTVEEKIEVSGKKKTERRITLTNGWMIVFADEPDIGIYDDRGSLRVAIEIKGSMDKAGAQTRYGEAKKSFAKALRKNAQCETIYLASCFTDSVSTQIREDAQVRKIFNLVNVLASEKESKKFLDELFRHQIRIM